MEGEEITLNSVGSLDWIKRASSTVAGLLARTVTGMLTSSLENTVALFSKDGVYLPALILSDEELVQGLPRMRNKFI